MSFLKSFNEVKTASLTLSTTPQPLATPWTLSNSRDGGRIAVEVNNIAGENPVYIGDEDVSSSNGIAIKAGETRVFPVLPGSANRIFVVGTASASVIVADYYG